MVSLHLDGHSVGTIGDSFLCPAMRRVGDLWRAGELSVADEHVATLTAMYALRSLESTVGLPRSLQPLVLACSVEQDYHDFPVRLAALTLTAGGCDTLNIGMSTPFSALAETVERFRPRLVCISSVEIHGLDRAVREYGDFMATARKTGTLVVLGGAGFADRDTRLRFPADLHAKDFRQLEAFITDLAARRSA
jgi:methanogenic corrinoid protein MtbC1